MKTMRNLILAGMALVCLCVSRPALAGPPTTAAATPPTTVVPNNDTDLNRDLTGVPASIKDLIIGFDKTRDKFLAQQAVLLAKLKNATTDAERDRIRAELQDNRAAFLDALRDYRGQLKTELAALKSKISHAEFLRIVDAAHDAATEGGAYHHKGN